MNFPPFSRLSKYIAPRVAILISPLSLHSSEILWSENFQNGACKAVPYHQIETLEILRDEGKPFLRAILPGKKSLEGIRIPAGALEGNRFIFVHAKVRGKGSMSPMIEASNGWTRLPEIPLSDTWQEIRIPKTLKPGPNPLTLYFVALPRETPQQGAVYEISDISITAADPLTLEEKDVPPIHFEAEDYASEADLIRHDENGEETFLARSTPFKTQEIPFPQTSRSITIYARCRAATATDRVQLCTHRGGAKQVIREIVPEPENGWQWLAFPEVVAEEIGESFTLEIWPAESHVREAALDAFVVSTEPALDPGTLDSVQ